MSKNRRNNHYHYAEKYSDRQHKRARTAYLPFKAVIASLVVLLMFGLVSTTFGAYITENEPEYDSEHNTILSEVRNMKASREVAVTGANAELAETGGNVSGGTVYVEVPSGWTSYSNIQFGLYQNGYLWCSDDLTRIANTRIYYGSAPDHSSWSNEQIMFMANNSHFDSGSFDGTNAAKYTGKLTQAMSSGKHYFFTYTSTSNGGTLTATRTAKDSAGEAIGVYNQTANIVTKSTSTGSYTSNGAGGNVTITAYWLDIDNNQAAQTTTPSSGGATSVTYDNAVYHTAVTYTATANSGYRFVGWATSATGTPTSTSATYQYTTSLTGTKTLYAQFIKTYTVSITKSPSAYTGTAPTFTYNSTNYTSTSVDVGSSITLNGNVSTSGISCTFHLSTATGTTITSPYTGTTANRTIYAVYTLTAPTISTFTYSGSPTVEGASAISPTKTVTSAAGNSGNLSYAYTFVTGGTGPSTGYTLNASTGAFSATVAGTYNIRLTATDTVSGLTASATKDFTITVKPSPVTGISYEVTGYNSGSGTYAAPYKVPVNSTSFEITSYIPDDGSRDSNYTYTWTRTDGTYLLSNGTITAGSHTATGTGYIVTDTATSGTETADVIHNTVLADTQGYIYKVAVTKTRNSVTSEPYYVTFYYGVTADFLVIDEFDFKDFNEDDPIQKIYAEDNGITYITSAYEAGGTNFHTMLFFSNDNITDNKVAVWTPSSFTITAGNLFAGTHTALPNDSSHQVSTLITQISTVARNSANLMATAGPKWFKGYVDDYQNARVDPCYPVIHTTVGTSSISADRPFYYKDTTGSTYTDCRVMAFYVLNGETTVHYQTAQTSTNSKYRFYLPSNAQYITFAHVAETSYVLPSFASATFSMSATSSYLKAWTETINLLDSANIGKNMYTATAKTTSSGINNYTGSMGYLT